MQQNISVKFDGLINDIQEKNKCLENANEMIRNSLNKVEQSKSITNENYNEMCKNVVPDKELINNNDDVENNENNNVIENVVSESDKESTDCLLYTSRCV